MNIRKKIFIHIGTHKTGSTAIQNSLNSNKYQLKKEKIIYLSQPFPQDILDNIGLIKVSNEINITKTKKFLIHQTKKYSRDYRFVISYEGFSGNHLEGYYNSHIIANVLSSITEEFDPYVIVYLRRQDLFVESLYTQLIQQGECFSFNEFKNQIQIFDWAILLKNYSQYFPKNKIIVRRYDKTILPNPNSIIKDFANIINSQYLKTYDLSDYTPNIGYSRDALEIARVCNKNLNKYDKLKLRHILQNSNPRKLFDNFNFFSSQEREEFLSKVEDSNKNIAKEYLDAPNGKLFPQDEYNIKRIEEYKGLTPLSSSIVIIHAIINLNKSEPITFKIVRKLENQIKNLINRFLTIKSFIINILEKYHID